MFRKKIAYSMLALLISCFITTHALTISDYHPTFIPLYDKQQELQIAIRMYYIKDVLYFLVVNPNTFATQTAPANTFLTRKTQTTTADPHRSYTIEELQQTPYIRALTRYTSSPYFLQNYGITHAENPTTQGVFLTADMCTSVLTFETDFFNTLVKIANRTHKPTPIALSVSGLWIIHHPKEFQWLIQQEKNNKLQITWVNHSFSHIYYHDAPLRHNFLLAEHTNVPQEILATEKILLENGQLPSVLFRFPGLVSDKKLILQLRKFGLIPIGSDAWLAKQEIAKHGSIILVHGNSNEPQGIELVMPLLKNPNIELLPLSSAFLK